MQSGMNHVYLSWVHQSPHPTTTTILHAPTILFFHPRRSELLYKTLSHSFSFCCCLCVCVFSFHSLILFHSNTHTFPLTSFLRLFIWLGGNKIMKKREFSLKFQMQHRGRSGMYVPTLVLQPPASSKPCRMAWKVQMSQMGQGCMMWRMYRSMDESCTRATGNRQTAKR